MKLSVAKEAILACWQTGRVPLLVGEPGIGKSEAVFQAAKSVNRLVAVTKNLAMEDPVDLKGYGFPDMKEGVTKILPLKWAHDLLHGAPAVVFLDEYGQGLPSTQAASAPMLLPDPTGKRRIGDLLLDMDHYFVGATNEVEHNSCVYKMPDFVASRVTEVPVSFSYDDWDAWAVKNDIHPFVLAYGRLHNGAIHQYVRGVRCPLARSWTFVSNFEKLNPRNEVLNHLVAGTIGKPAAAQYWELRNTVDKLPRMEDILKGRTAKVPTEKPLQFLVTCILLSRTDRKTVGNVLDYIGEFPGEFRQTFFDDLVAKDKDIVSVRAVQEYIAKHDLKV